MTGRRHSRGVWGALVLMSLALATACQGTAVPTPDDLPSPAPSLVVLDAVTSRQVGGGYAPLDLTSRFSPDDTFYCVVQVSNAERATEILARWFYRDDLIREEAYTTEASGTGYVAFELSSQQSWPEGQYRVEILSAGVLLRTVEFRVTK